ncbi:kinase-like protein [Meredithblackwellia eburnea MCA 4105]
MVAWKSILLCGTSPSALPADEPPTPPIAQPASSTVQDASSPVPNSQSAQRAEQLSAEPGPATASKEAMAEESSKAGVGAGDVESQSSGVVKKGEAASDGQTGATKVEAQEPDVEGPGALVQEPEESENYQIMSSPLSTAPPGELPPPEERSKADPTSLVSSPVESDDSKAKDLGATPDVLSTSPPSSIHSSPSASPAPLPPPIAASPTSEAPGTDLQHPVPRAPPSAHHPRLTKLHQSGEHSVGLIPPTPIEAPQHAGPGGAAGSAFVFPIPKSTSPVPSIPSEEKGERAPSPTGGLGVQQEQEEVPIQRSASPDAFIRMAPDVPPSPGSPSSSLRAPPSSSSPNCDHPTHHAYHHRRTSSTGDRSFKETLNAFTADGENGTRSVNQYIIKERLGAGSYATVERATDRVTRVDYAVKEFSKARLKRKAAQDAFKGQRGRGPRGRPSPRFGAGRPTMEDRKDSSDDVGSPVDLDEQGPINLSLVRSEVAIMKKVNHPNVASVHEVIDVTSTDALLVVMELCAGGPITQVSLESQSAPMEEDRARFIFGQMLMGIAYLHHNNIIHRDIKPDNCLFLADKETVKLVDFGVSQMFTKDNSILEKSTGSPAFMAPELLGKKTGEPPNGFACDVWSFGVTLYAMVAGRLPFVKDNIFDLMESIKDDEVVYPDTFSPDLTNLLRKMLAREPSKRITPREMWDDPWVTSGGSDPLPCTFEENNADPIVPPSEEELDAALMSFQHKVLVARAANKFRRSTLGPRKDTSGSWSTSDGGSSVPPSPGPGVGSQSGTGSAGLGVFGAVGMLSGSAVSSASEGLATPSPLPSPLPTASPLALPLPLPTRKGTASSEATNVTDGTSEPQSTPSSTPEPPSSSNEEKKN